jgi:alpha-tubulin suppressor-like RCC1 family protein
MGCTNVNPLANFLGKSTAGNNNSSASISVSDQTVNEYGIAKVTVSLSAASTKDVSFNYYTNDSTAFNVTDYLGISNSSATIPAGQTSINLPVSVYSNYSKTASPLSFLFGIKDVMNASVSKSSSMIQITDDEIYQKISGVAQIARGDSHACLRTTAGTVKCWGDNAYGQIGNGTNFTATLPTDVIGLSGTVVHIATGDFHSCAVTSAGAVQCWGFNTNYQLGDGTTTDRNTPVNVSSLGGAVSSVEAGFGHTCALLSSGAVQCWGYNFNGQIGDNTTTTRPSPTTVSGLSSVIKIALGGYHSCAITPAGVKCWGRNTNGQLGDSSTTQRLMPTNSTGLSSGVSDIDAGEYFTCAVHFGAAKCWGSNALGQVGDGTGIQRNLATSVTSLATSVASVSAGKNHACAVQSGTAYCWGSNLNGQLGNGTITTQLSPVIVANLTNNIDKMSAGAQNTCALLFDQTLTCWGAVGANAEFIGDAKISNRLTPVDVSGLIGAQLIHGDVGGNHTCIVLDSGIIKCWGSNSNGQIGDGTTISKITPTTVVGISGATKVSASDFHTCAIGTSGGAYCWGANSSGELGDGTTTSRSSASITGLASGVKQIATGGGFSCALTSSNGVKCWGSNSSGQLGDSTTTNRTSPVDVIGLTSGVSSIAVGGGHACALLNGGTVKCWGNNPYGQLGDNTTTNRTSPVDVIGLADAESEIMAGSFHTCVTTTSKRVKCWGYNTDGQLGDGTTTNRTTPVLVSSLISTINSLTLGNNHSCAKTTSEALYCWGQNYNGQVGDGTTTSPRATPIAVSAFSLGILGVSAGGANTCVAPTSGGVKCWGINNIDHQTGDSYSNLVPQFVLSP